MWIRKGDAFFWRHIPGMPRTPDTPTTASSSSQYRENRPDHAADKTL